MINNKFICLIKEKVANIYLVLFVFIMAFIGIGINHFEPYPLFYILFLLLIIMFTTTIAILRMGLKRLDNFKMEYAHRDSLAPKLEILFSDTGSGFITFIFILVIIIYFLCLYQLNFLEFNLMGLYIFFLGGGTFFIGLISYEMYLRVIIALGKISTDTDFIKNTYNRVNPKETLWFRYLFQLSKLLKNASLIIGVLFVSENSLIYLANINIYCTDQGSEEVSFCEKLLKMPIEFWIIWVFVLLSIGVAFPIIAIIHSLYIKRIIVQIRNTFAEKILSQHTEDELYQKPIILYVTLSTIENVETALEKTFLPRKTDKAITLISSILTCIIHITTLLTNL